MQVSQHSVNSSYFLIQAMDADPIGKGLTQYLVKKSPTSSGQDSSELLNSNFFRECDHSCFSLGGSSKQESEGDSPNRSFGKEQLLASGLFSHDDKSR